MSNFKCDKCGIVNIDCRLGGFKTPREIELEERIKELQQANIHIDNNRKCKAKKLKEIEQLAVACMSGYTDELIQNIMEIIHKSEVMD